MAVGSEARVVSIEERRGTMKRAMHEVFDLGPVKAAMNAKGNPIMVTSYHPDAEAVHLVPEKDPNYIFNIDLLKVGVMALELNMKFYTWGYHGTGKTTFHEQMHAHLSKPFLRVQHTINTEEAHILGQMLVKDGSTYFEPGPLPLAMRHGWTYCADEYDRAPSTVLSVYQPVLEGKPLVIKEAPLDWRIVKPHANFRFVATGNSNGVGDETGLYQSTQMGDASNYSRFGVTEEVGYMPDEQETAVVAAQGGIDKKDAAKLVKFANEVRTAYKGGRIGSTISPRELINAAQIGLVRGSDWRGGLRYAFANRLSRVDKEVCEQFAQRLFG
jgi:cobaltochelatase CobS